MPDSARPSEGTTSQVSAAQQWRWCEWTERHPPHLYAVHDDDAGDAVFACSGEGDDDFYEFGVGDPPDPLSDRL